MGGGKQLPVQVMSKTDAVLSINEYKSGLIASAKKSIQEQRNRTPVRVDNLINMVRAWDTYTMTQRERRQPVTWAGYAMSAGVSYDTINRLRSGELDYIIEEYRTCNDLNSVNIDLYTGEVLSADNAESAGAGKNNLILPSDLVKLHCELPIMDQLESNCYQLKGNQVGSIFGLKARFGWQDDSPQVQHNTAVVVADADKARNLLEMINPAKR